MIKGILAALDGSSAAEVAAGNASLVARWFGAKLRGLFVNDSAEQARLAALPVTPGTPIGGAVTPSVLVNLEELEREAAKRRAEVADYFSRLCRQAGLPEGELETLRGRPAECIVRLSRQVDLVSLGRSGLDTGPDKRAIGSTTEAVLHHTNKPVLVSSKQLLGQVCLTRTGSTNQLPGPILVAYDGRNPANTALAVAGQFAEVRGLELIVLTVAEQENQAQPLFEEARNYLAAHGQEARFLWEKGPLTQAVLSQLEATGAGLVAMGAFGKSRLREVFLGSHTRRVLLACDCPVLLTC